MVRQPSMHKGEDLHNREPDMDQDFIAIVGLGVTMLALMWNTRSETFRRFAEMKQDTTAQFTEMKQDTTAQFAEMKQDTNARFAEMKQDTNARFAEMKQDTNARFAEMKQDTTAQFAEMKQSMDTLKQDLDARFDSVERKTDTLTHIVYGLAERTARIEGVLLGPGQPADNGGRGPWRAEQLVQEEEDRPISAEGA